MHTRPFLIMHQIASRPPETVTVIDFEVGDTYAASQSNIGPQLRQYVDEHQHARRGMFFAVPVTATVGR